MMAIELSQLLDQPDALEAQIKFCEMMAEKTARHDRDISKMYQSITKTLQKLEAPEQLIPSQHDPIIQQSSPTIT